MPAQNSGEPAKSALTKTVTWAEGTAQAGKAGLAANRQVHKRRSSMTVQAGVFEMGGALYLPPCSGVSACRLINHGIEKKVPLDLEAICLIDRKMETITDMLAPKFQQEER
jgi:hypothetical protein